MSRDNMDLDIGGVKYDDGKPRYDLLPSDALEELVAVYTYGANKYRDRNWEVGMRWGRVFAATMRHLWAWMRGESYDPDTGFHHAAHAAFGCFALIAFDKRGIGEDDRPLPVPAAGWESVTDDVTVNVPSVFVEPFPSGYEWKPDTPESTTWGWPLTDYEQTEMIEQMKVGDFVIVDYSGNVYEKIAEGSSGAVLKEVRG